VATTTYAINPVTGQTLVNETTAGDQFDPSVVAAAAGDAAVFYVSGSETPPIASGLILGRLVGNDGTPIGQEVNASGVRSVEPPSVARLTNGDDVLAWTV
jgi:hypothetical protein